LPIHEGMQNPTGIAVSKEEEQFLRSAFRRFALPYVLIVAAVAWIASTMMWNEAPSGSPKEMSSLAAKVAALEKSVAAMEGRIAKVDGELERAGTRVGALESRKPATAPASGDTNELERAVRDATRRVTDLERRDAANATAAERIDALSARMQRIESAARASAAPAPGAFAPVPAAPAPAPAP
jgi:polyhydroxyalkanoate synthesis regulator phasin